MLRDKQFMSETFQNADEDKDNKLTLKEFTSALTRPIIFKDGENIL